MATIELSDSKQNKLGLVNRCLQAIGEAPLPLGTIPSEFPLGSDSQVSSSIVDDTWLAELSKGWWFNTDINFNLYPDSEGFISLPETILRIDGGRYQNVIIRNGMLYDRVLKSFKFDETVVLDIVWATSYSDLPISMYEYLASKAARKFYQRVIGSPAEGGALVQDELDTLVTLQREHNTYIDPSLIESQVSFRWTNPLRSF